MYPRRRLRAPCLMMHGSPYYLEPSMGIWDHLLGPSFWGRHFGAIFGTSQGGGAKGPALELGWGWDGMGWDGAFTHWAGTGTGLVQ